MNVTKDSSSPTEVVLNVELAPEDEEPFLNRSCRRLAARVQIPGFRPGKAPRSIIESHLGRATLVQEAIEFMVPETLDQVLKQEDLQAFAEPDLEMLEMEPVSFKAVVPLEPIVELGDLSSVKLERQSNEVTDENVAEVIERFRYDAAPWEPAERPVRFGDLVTLDVKGVIGGEEVMEDEGVDYIPELDNPLPAPGFSVHLEGMTEGQQKEFTLTFAEDYAEEEYAGKECRMNVLVHAIKEKILPELDDEFAKGVRDGYESLEALRDYVREQLTEAAESASRRKAEQDGLEELAKVSTVQASGLLYERELDAMCRERERSLRGHRLDMETYLSMVGQSEEEWREQLKPLAEQRLNTTLLLRKLARDQDIDVDSDEVETQIETMVGELTQAQDSLRQAFSSDAARDSVRSSLFRDKVVQRLLELIEGPGPEAAAPPGEPPVASEDSGEADRNEDEGPPGEDPAEAASPLSPEVNEEGAKPDAE